MIMRIKYGDDRVLVRDREIINGWENILKTFKYGLCK